MTRIGEFSVLFRVVLAGMLLALAGCEPAEPTRGPVYGDAPVQPPKPVYRLAVHPLHNPAMLMRAYQPLADSLNAAIPEARFEIEASRNYAEYEAKIRARAPAFLLPNPWQTLQAMQVGYSVLAMAGDAADFKGLFIVRRDSPIKSVFDLKGRTLAYPSPTALAACIMPQWYLHQQGLDVMRDTASRYVGSQESAIMNAYLGQTDVGVTWPPPWRTFVRTHPAEAAKLKVLWQTPPLINNSVMARGDVPAALRVKVRARLAELHMQAPGRALLAGMETARFHVADDADYAVVSAFIERFEAAVRPVVQP